MSQNQSLPQHERPVPPVDEFSDGQHAQKPATQGTKRKAGQGKRSFWKRARRGLLWLFIMAVVSHIGLNVWATVLLNRELAAARGRGEPLTLAEMAAPPVPDKQNAAVLYEQAEAKLTPEARRKLNHPRNKENGELGDKLLKENLPAIAMVRQAAQMQHCRFNVTIDNPITAKYPHLAMMRQLARLMNQQAQLEAGNGNLTQAIADVQTIFSLSRHLEREPILIGYLVNIAIEQIGYKAWATVLEKAKLTRQQGETVLKNLPSHKSSGLSAPFVHAMLGERAFGLYSFELLRADPSQLAQMTSPDDGSEDSPEQPSEPSLLSRPLLLLGRLLWSPISKLDELQYIRFMNRVIAGSIQTPFQETATLSEETLIKELPSYALVTRILAPVYSHVIQIRNRGLVGRNLAEVGVAVCVYRTATGKYPKHLSEVATHWSKPLPLDPNSNKPFHYQSAGQSYLIYGVGPNGKDDGGKNKNNPQEDDILYPPQRR